MKNCPQCGLQAFENFGTRQGKLKSWCRACEAADQRRRFAENPDKINAASKKWRARNPEQARAAVQAWRAENPEKDKAATKSWKKRNPEKIRYRNDVEFRVKSTMKARIRIALKSTTKCSSTKNLVGCSIGHLRAHLEAQFKPGITWDNYGSWHIDHIRPCASFDLSDPAQQRQCFHYSNLQPLWAAENLKKGSKYAQN